MLGALALGSLGCGVVGRLVPQRGAGPAPAPATSSYSLPPTYNSNASGEVVGTNCHYDQGSKQIRYDLSIQNSSSELTFKYSIYVRFSGGDTPFSDDLFGNQSLDVTVGPGMERKLTVTQGYNLTKRTYIGCNVQSASKIKV
ncbi:hypothetical protein AB0J86_16880 [Micromonospora sp. NPDC049559]|uniref:hypothetical protein n=1 Tax=Micromonospora sp. NPDC049559 TaxID=3155923 RepID=UPI00342E2599